MKGKMIVEVDFRTSAGTLGGRPITVGGGTEPDPVGKLVIAALSSPLFDKPDELQSFRQGALAWQIEKDMQAGRPTGLTHDDVEMIRKGAVKTLNPPCYHVVRMLVDPPEAEEKA